MLLEQTVELDSNMIFSKRRAVLHRNQVRILRGSHFFVCRKTALSMVFKLMMPAKKKWRKLSSTNRLPQVIQGVEFKDGIKLLKKSLNQAVTRFWA